MTLQYSEGLRNARLDVQESYIGPAPILRIYTGSAPANPAAAATGTLLVEATLPSDWMTPASGGVKTMSGTWQDLSANNSGTFGYYRIYESTGTTCDEQGSAGTSGTDMIMSAASVTAGQAVQVLSYQKTDPHA